MLTSIDSNNSNVSNYIQAVDSNLNNIINTKDANISNYTSIVNVRVREFVNTKDANMSNYVINIDSRLTETIAIRDANISNYTLSVNNRLTSNITTRDGNVSNYVLAVNNRITASLNTKEAALSNYSLNINDRLSGIISANDNTMSNFLLNNSNTLALRINNITTDEINKGVNNKFIVNNYHNDILNVAGKFNIFSNSNFVDIVNVYEDNINSNTILKILQLVLKNLDNKNNVIGTAKDTILANQIKDVVIKMGIYPQENLTKHKPQTSKKKELFVSDSIT